MGLYYDTKSADLQGQVDSGVTVLVKDHYMGLYYDTKITIWGYTMIQRSLYGAIL